MGQSLSAMRKKLEKENICKCLKGRIKYFVTLYRESHDGWEGRISVSIDNKEIFKSNTFEWWGFLDRWTGSSRDHKMMYNKSHIEGIVNVHSFYWSFYYYQNHSISESLCSEDALVRLFAILDKRVGKRTLKRLETDLSIQPQWLQVFYKLRLETEGIIRSVSVSE